MAAKRIVCTIQGNRHWGQQRTCCQLSKGYGHRVHGVLIDIDSGHLSQVCSPP